MALQHNYKIGIDNYGHCSDLVIRDNDSIIAVLSSDEGPAQHLVRAGNCHDELLDALLIALPYVEDALNDPVFKKGTVKKDVATVRTAIDKAEGRG